MAIFRDRDNAALQRHTALVGTDGAGTYFVACGCDLTFTLPDWPVHLRAVVASVRRKHK